MYHVKFQVIKFATPGKCLGTTGKTLQACVFFHAIIGNGRLTDEIPTTTFCLFEQIVNARPLDQTSADATDLDVLTPNHFLLGTAGSSLPSTLFSEFDQKKRYARAQTYFNAIWSRWLRKYVPTLKRRSKRFSSTDRDLKTGDLLWIVETNSPRGYCPLESVVKLKNGSDAIASSAEVRTVTGNVIGPLSNSLLFYHPL